METNIGTQVPQQVPPYRLPVRKYRSLVRATLRANRKTGRWPGSLGQLSRGTKIPKYQFSLAIWGRKRWCVPDDLLTLVIQGADPVSILKVARRHRDRIRRRKKRLAEAKARREAAQVQEAASA